MLYPKHSSVAVREPCSDLWSHAYKWAAMGLCTADLSQESTGALCMLHFSGALRAFLRDSAFKYVYLWGLCVSTVHFLRAAGRSLKNIMAHRDGFGAWCEL